ncbi:MAG: SDR family oxidoreductase [Bryobacter sp.]|nr:SDR family oxidoreductase [Bryobacter sp. CoA8 C33]
MRQAEGSGGRSERVALVTGASSGIGAALAEALAGRGMHVVLTARSADRLEALVKRIEAAGGKATAVAADLSRPGAAKELFAAVEALDLPVDTLVNCAGFGIHGYFETHEPAKLSAMLQVNVVALCELTHCFAPQLLERRGVVLNIASTAAFQPTPYMSAYGATKAFVLSLSEALWAEHQERGLRVVAVCPGPVETPFIDAMGPDARSMKLFSNPLAVSDVVAACLSALEQKGPTRVVGLGNWLLSYAIRLMPRTVVARVSGGVIGKPKH